MNVKKQELLSLTLCLLLAYQPIAFFINTITNMFLGEGFIYDTLLIYLVLFLFLLKSLRSIVHSFKKDVMFFLGFMLLAYSITYFLFEENRAMMFTSLLDVMGNPLYVLFVFAFFGYLLMRHITDLSLLRDYLRTTSVIVVVTSIISFLLMTSSREVPQYMVFSYNMLVFTAFLIIDSIDQKKGVHFFIGLSGGITIILAGSRGATISLLGSIVLYVLFRKEKRYVKFLIITSLIAFVYLFFQSITAILQVADNITSALGFSSRTLELYISGMFLDDSGRTDIQQQQLALLKLKPMGFGLYGDRVAAGSYSHNIFIELLVQWGYLMGPILILLLLVAVARGLMSKDPTRRLLCIVFSSTGLFKLLFSGSYLNQEPSLYVLIALSVYPFRSRNHLLRQSVLHSSQGGRECELLR